MIIKSKNILNSEIINMNIPLRKTHSALFCLLLAIVLLISCGTPKNTAESAAEETASGTAAGSTETESAPEAAAESTETESAPEAASESAETVSAPEAAVSSLLVLILETRSRVTR